MSVTKPRLKKIAVAAVALVVLVAGAAVAVLARSGREVTTTSKGAYELYLKGLEDERRMYHQDALAAYAKALELDPHFAMATLRLAGNLAGRDRDRARSLVQCVSRNPGNLNEREKLFLAMSEADLLERDPKKFGSLVREYVRRFPDDPEGYYRLAGVLMREGKADETLATYERLLSLDPNQAAAYNFLGYHYIGKRDFVKGEDYLKRYRFLAPDQANPYDSLGELYANTGRYGEAEDYLKRALQIRPDFIPAIGHFGTLEFSRGHPEVAAGYFQRAADMSEGWREKAGFSVAAALSLLAAGRPDEALIEAERLVLPASAPSSPEEFMQRFQAGRLHSVILALSGHADEAEAELAPLTEFPADLAPKDREYLEKSLAGPRAAIAGARGDREGAIRLLRALLADEEGSRGDGFGYYPGIFDLRVRIADALVTLGRPNEARKELQPVLSVNPRFAPALDVLARARGRSPAAKGSAGR